jgi:hypothetical protein
MAERVAICAKINRWLIKGRGDRTIDDGTLLDRLQNVNYRGQVLGTPCVDAV